MRRALHGLGREPAFRALVPACETILRTQAADGAIPWFENGPWDPWNHAECAMALGVMGEDTAAAAALDCLEARQLPDGAWLGGYGNALPMAGRLHLARTPVPALKDINFIAYPAVAVWHRLVLTGDRADAKIRFAMVERALGFVLARQHDEGDFPWCAEAFGTAIDDSLIAGNAAIHMALDCAIALAGALDFERPLWRAARARLRHALLRRPERFGRARTNTAGFAMDWYYPVLAGLMTPLAARQRLEAGRDRFVRFGLGSHCVETEPWVTVAESAELALTLARLGARNLGQRLLGWQEQHRDSDGAYWMGYQYDEQIVWPREKPSWTQAAIILAQDALSLASPAARVLTSAQAPD